MYVDYNEKIMERVYRAIFVINQDIPGICIKTPEAIVLALWATASDQTDHQGEADGIYDMYESLAKSETLYQAELNPNNPNSPYVKAYEVAFEEAVAYENKLYTAMVVTLALAPLEEYPQLTWEQILLKVNAEFKDDRDAFDALVGKSLGQAWSEKPQ
jgi:hypothetical protein